MSEETRASVADQSVTSVDVREAWTSTEQRSSRSMFSIYSMALRKISTFGSRCVDPVESRQARCFSASNAMFTCTFIHVLVTTRVICPIHTADADATQLSSRVASASAV